MKNKKTLLATCIYVALMLTATINTAIAEIQLISFKVEPEYLIFGKAKYFSDDNPIRTDPLNPVIVKALAFFHNTFPGGGIDVKNILAVCKKNGQEILLNQSISPPSFGYYLLTFEIPPGMEGGRIYLKWEQQNNNAWQVYYSLSNYTLNNNHINSTPVFRYYYPFSGDKLKRVYSIKSENICVHAGEYYPFCFSPFKLFTDWTYEGYIGFINIKQEVNTVPIYCYVDTKSGDTFLKPYNDFINNYIIEEKLGYAYTKVENEKSKPVYQYWNGKFHYITDNFLEFGLGRDGYKFEKIPFFLQSDNPSYLYSPLAYIAGIDIANNDWVYYWGKDGKFVIGTSTTINKYNNTGLQYTLPVGKSYEDIISVGITSSYRCYAWYNDGTMSAGKSNDLGYYIAPKNFVLPAGRTPSDIVAITIDKVTDWCTAWYKDGTGSVGNSTNLGAYLSSFNYTIAPNKTFSDIMEIGTAGSTNYYYIWYKDWTMSVGMTKDDLDSFIALKSMDK